jgi:hypothetical protein
VVILPDNYELEVGKTGAEMIIYCPTVVKEHATFKYDSILKEITLYDNNSKHGTW